VSPSWCDDSPCCTTARQYVDDVSLDAVARVDPVDDLFTARRIDRVDGNLASN